jgi:hypothetical protein
VVLLVELREVIDGAFDVALDTPCCSALVCLGLGRVLTLADPPESSVRLFAGIFHCDLGPRPERQLRPATAWLAVAERPTLRTALRLYDQIQAVTGADFVALIRGCDLGNRRLGEPLIPSHGACLWGTRGTQMRSIHMISQILNSRFSAGFERF